MSNKENKESKESKNDKLQQNALIEKELRMRCLELALQLVSFQSVSRSDADYICDISRRMWNFVRCGK